MKFTINTKHSTLELKGNVTLVAQWVFFWPWNTLVPCSYHTAARGNSERIIACISRTMWSEDCFYYCSEKKNVVVLFGTLKVQSFILTEVTNDEIRCRAIVMRQRCVVKFHKNEHCQGVATPGIIRWKGPKNPDGLNLGIHIFAYFYKVHMCIYVLRGGMISWINCFFLLTCLFFWEK